MVEAAVHTARCCFRSECSAAGDEVCYRRDSWAVCVRLVFCPCATFYVRCSNKTVRPGLFLCYWPQLPMSSATSDAIGLHCWQTSRLFVTFQHGQALPCSHAPRAPIATPQSHRQLNKHLFPLHSYRACAWEALSPQYVSATCVLIGAIFVSALHSTWSLSSEAVRMTPGGKRLEPEC